MITRGAENEDPYLRPGRRCRFGLLAIIGGWVIEGTKGYVPGLLANLGTAAFLGVVFLAIQTRIGTQIEEVSDQAVEAREEVRTLRREFESLEELTPQTLAKVQGARAEVASDLSALREGGTFEGLEKVFARG